LFHLNVTGIQTWNDDLLTASNYDELKDRIDSINEYAIDEKLIKKLSYRPFDNKYCYYIEWLSKNPYEKIHFFLFYYFSFNALFAF
jgi:hypothetical protein